MSDRLQEAASGQTAPKRGFGAWIAGRAGRREYWLWLAPIFLLAMLLGAFELTGFELVLGLPMLLVWIRRLHDLGRTGWLAPLINLILSATTVTLKFTAGPDIAMIANTVLAIGAVIALGALPGQRTTNAYGPPTGRHGAIAETFS